MKKVNRAPYVIISFLLPFLYGILYTWSLYRTTLLELYPSLTAGDLSMVYSTHVSVVGLTNIAYGYIRKRIKLKPRFFMRLGLTCICVGVFSMGYLPAGQDKLAYTIMMCCIGVLAPIGIGLCQSTSLTTNIRWFPENMGIINGFVMGTFALSSFGLGAIVTFLQGRFEFFDVFKIVSIGIFVIGMIASHWTVLPGPDVQLPPMTKHKENKSDRSYSVKDVLKSPIFWCVLLYSSCQRACSQTMTDHAATIAMAFGMAGMFGMLYSPANAGTAYIAGALLNKLGVSNVMSLASSAMLFGTLGLIVCYFANFGLGIVICMIIIGAAFGSASGTNATTLRVLFGDDNYEVVYSMHAPATVISGIIAAICGKLLDLFDNSYLSVFVVLATCALLCFICVIIMRRAIKKREASMAAMEAAGK